MERESTEAPETAEAVSCAKDLSQRGFASGRIVGEVGLAFVERIQAQPTRHCGNPAADQVILSRKIGARGLLVGLDWAF